MELGSWEALGVGVVSPVGLVSYLLSSVTDSCLPLCLGRTEQFQVLHVQGPPAHQSGSE